MGFMLDEVGIQALEKKNRKLTRRFRRLRDDNAERRDKDYGKGW